MEYLNKDALFDDEAIDQENADADILALDRGEMVQAHKEENHVYVIKRLTHRMKQKDFDSLSPQIRQNYEQKRAQHDQLNAQLIQAAQALKAGFIPTGGYLVSCDFYQPNPDPTKAARRLRVPSLALEWLVKTLEQQGLTEASIQSMEQADQARAASYIQQPPPQLSAGQPALAGAM